MDDSFTRQANVLELLGQDQLQNILDRFLSIIIVPFCVVTPEGNVLAAMHFPDEVKLDEVQFQIDHAQKLVKGCVTPESWAFPYFLAIPVLFQSDVAGFVVGFSKQPLQEDMVARAQFLLVSGWIGEKAYSEFEIENLTEELVARYNEVNLMYDISSALGAVFDPIEVCKVILGKAVDVIGVGKASIMLYDEDNDQLYIATTFGWSLSEDEIRTIIVDPSSDQVSAKVYRTREHILVENINETLIPDVTGLDRLSSHRVSSPLSDDEYTKDSFLSVPMIRSSDDSEKNVMGVINMTNKKGTDMFTSGEIQLVKAIASQAAISLYNIKLVEEVKDAERVKKDMEIAEQVQTSLLPTHPPELPGIELVGKCLPATQVGGDYYDFFLNTDDKLGIVIADVSGHSIGAALMMAVARSRLRSEVLTQQSPSQILRNTNVVLYDDLTHSELFITMFYAELDLRTRVLRYSNGGHNLPIVLRDGHCTFLDTDGMLIGMLESVDFEEKTEQLHPQDIVVFYTDGVVEAINENREMFKLERFCQVLEAHSRDGAQQLLETIYDELARYSGSYLRSDDITVVVLKIHETGHN